MNSYTFTLHLEVEVSAYSEEDAVDILNDTFGPGEDCGVTIVKTSIEGN